MAPSWGIHDRFRAFMDQKRSPMENIRKHIFTSVKGVGVATLEAFFLSFWGLFGPSLAFLGLLGLYRRTEAIKGRQNASGVDPRSTFHGSKDVFPNIFHRTTFLVHEGAESLTNPP